MIAEKDFRVEMYAKGGEWGRGGEWEGGL